MIPHFWNALNKQAGFSLPEVLVGGAILVGVGMAGSMIFREQSKAQSRVEHDQILSQFHAQLSKTLENTPNCNATMKSISKFNATSIGTADSATLNSLSICDTTTTTCNLSSGADIATPLTYISEGEWIDKGANSRQLWRVKDISFSTTRSDSGPIRLRVTYELNPRIAVREVAKEIILNVRFTVPTSGPKLFYSCFNDQESSVNNLQNDICKTLNPVSSTGIASNGTLVVFDESTQSCVLQGTTASPLKDCRSSMGLMVEGIRSTGTVHCKSITDGFDPNPLFDNGSVTCPVGQKPKMIWDGVTKKMKIACDT